MRLLAGLLAALALWMAYDGYRSREAARVQRNDLATQTAYLCSTTHVLDELVRAARDQIRLNFKNGTYKRLLREGVLTRENVRAARATLQKYQASHLILSQTKPCEGVEG